MEQADHSGLREVLRCLACRWSRRRVLEDSKSGGCHQIRNGEGKKLAEQIRREEGKP